MGSRSARPPRTAIKDVLGPWLRERAELPASIHDALNDGEKVEGRAGEAVYLRHRHHFTGSETIHHAQELTPISLRADGLLAVNFCAPVYSEPFTLRVKWPSVEIRA